MIRLVRLETKARLEADDGTRHGATSREHGTTARGTELGQESRTTAALSTIRIVDEAEDEPLANTLVAGALETRQVMIAPHRDGRERRDVRDRCLNQDRSDRERHCNTGR